MGRKLKLGMRKKKPVRAETNEELQGSWSLNRQSPDEECMPPPPPRDPPRVKLPPSPGKVARRQLKKTIKYAVKLLRKAEELGARALEKIELVKRIQQAKAQAPSNRGPTWPRCQQEAWWLGG